MLQPNTAGMQLCCIFDLGSYAHVCFRSTSENNCVKINADRHILSAAQICDIDSSFWQYKVCADIRSGSLER